MFRGDQRERLSQVPTISRALKARIGSALCVTNEPPGSQKGQEKIADPLKTPFSTM
jgi:hypothetical protein